MSCCRLSSLYASGRVPPRLHSTAAGSRPWRGGLRQDRHGGGREGQSRRRSAQVLSSQRRRHRSWGCLGLGACWRRCYLTRRMIGRSRLAVGGPPFRLRVRICGRRVAGLEYLHVQDDVWWVVSFEEWMKGEWWDFKQARQDKEGGQGRGKQLTGIHKLSVDGIPLVGIHEG